MSGLGSPDRIRRSRYAYALPSTPRAVVGPASLIAGSTARIRGASAFHTATYVAGLSDGRPRPLPVGPTQAGLPGDRSFPASPVRNRCAVPARLVITGLSWAVELVRL